MVARVVDEHGAAAPTADDAAQADGGRRQERVALDDVEAALVEVADALARMG